jgi:hypothetical protein
MVGVAINSDTDMATQSADTELSSGASNADLPALGIMTRHEQAGVEE